MTKGIYMQHITRRGFLGAMGAAALGSAALLAGCASGAPSGASSSSTSTSDPASSSTSASATANASSSASSSSASTAVPGKELVVVFSWSGNTLAMAERIRELSGADFFRIEPTEPYPEDYDATADQAKQEQDDGVIPAYVGDVDGWAQYGRVYLGYPIWWYELPQIVKGFIADHDWAGKEIVPFNSHEGSGNGGTPADIAEIAPGATMVEGINIRGDEVAGSLDRIDAWYAELE